MFRPRLGILASFVGAAIVLAGCGGASAPSSPAASSAAASKPASSAASSTPASSKPASASASAAASAQATGPIKIGVLMPMTGPAAVLGKDNTDAFNLYLSSLGNTIAGRKVEVIIADTQGKPDLDLTKAKELVENDKVAMLAGLNFNNECYAVAPYSAQAQIPTAVTGNCGGMALTLDPKLKSPWLVRLTQTSTALHGATADWAYSQGLRKVAIFALDSVSESDDAFAAAFVRRGGSVVQETYTSLGTTDFGPYLAKLDPSADAILLTETGIDGLRWAQQFEQYVNRKVQIFDQIGAMAYGSNLAQLKDKAVGVVAGLQYTEAIDNPLNKAFIKAWHDKYPDRVISLDTAQGYATAEMVAAAIQKVNGNVENKQALLDALLATDMDTIRGHVKVDQTHNIVQSTYIYQIVKEGNNVGPKILKTYPDLGLNFDWTPEALAKFPWGQMRGKWVGMTKDKLAQLTQ